MKCRTTVCNFNERQRPTETDIAKNLHPFIDFPHIMLVHAKMTAN